MSVALDTEIIIIFLFYQALAWAKPGVTAAKERLHSHDEAIALALCEPLTLKRAANADARTSKRASRHKER